MLIADFAPEGGDAFAQMEAKHQQQQERLQAELAQAKQDAAMLAEK